MRKLPVCGRCIYKSRALSSLAPRVHERYELCTLFEHSKNYSETSTAQAECQKFAVQGVNE